MGFILTPNGKSISFLTHQMDELFHSSNSLNKPEQMVTLQPNTASKIEKYHSPVIQIKYHFGNIILSSQGIVVMSNVFNLDFGLLCPQDLVKARGAAEMMPDIDPAPRRPGLGPVGVHGAWTKSRGLSRSMGWAMVSMKIIIFCFLIDESHCSLQHVRSAKKSGDSLNFLVVGDWGRKGLYNQSRVATQVIPGFHRLFLISKASCD
jgi:hypothetical protein